MTVKDWNKITRNISNGTYKMVRLARINKGSKDDILVSFNKVTSKTTEAIDRLNYIKSKIGDLEPGHYQVQCRVSPSNNSIQDCFNLIIEEKKMIQINANGNGEHKVLDKTAEQVETMNIDFKDYINAVTEAAELRAINAQLVIERDMYKKLLENGGGVQVRQLADEAPKEKSVTEIITSSLGDSMASLLPVAEQYFGLQQRKLDIEEKKLNLASKGNMVKKIKKRDLQAEAEDLEEELRTLCDNDPDEYNAYLDELEEEDPELYEMVCSVLGIEEEEEEEEEEEDNE